MELRTGGEVTVHIDAAPEAVYALVSDVTRTGEWSPECRRCRWVEGAACPTPGARFRGWNRSGFIRWSRLVEVISAHPGREFGWRTLPDRFNKDSTVWRYTLNPENSGTRITQAYAVDTLPRFPVNVIMRVFLRHHADMRPQMRQSLERIKAIAESDASPP